MSLEVAAKEPRLKVGLRRHGLYQNGALVSITLRTARLEMAALPCTRIAPTVWTLPGETSSSVTARRSRRHSRERPPTRGVCPVGAELLQPAPRARCTAVYQAATGRCDGAPVLPPSI